MHYGMLMGTVLDRSCISNGRGKEFMVPRATSHPVPKTEFPSISFHLLTLEFILTRPLPQWSPGPWKGWCDCCPLGWARDSHLLPAPWLVTCLCINCHPLPKQGSPTKAKSSTNLRAQPVFRWHFGCHVYFAKGHHYCEALVLIYLPLRWASGKSYLAFIKAHSLESIKINSCGNSELHAF